MAGVKEVPTHANCFSLVVVPIQNCAIVSYVLRNLKTPGNVYDEQKV